MRLLAITIGLLAAACGEVEPRAECDSLMTLDANGALTIDGEPCGFVHERTESMRRSIGKLRRTHSVPLNPAQEGSIERCAARLRIEVDPRAPYHAIGGLLLVLSLHAISDVEITTSDGSLSAFRPELPRIHGVSCTFERRSGPAFVEFVLTDGSEFGPSPPEPRPGAWWMYEQPEDDQAETLHDASWSQMLDALARRQSHGGRITITGIVDPQAPWSEVRALTARLEALEPGQFELIADL